MDASVVNFTALIVIIIVLFAAGMTSHFLR